MRRRRKGGLCAEGSWSRSIFDMEAEDGRLRIVDGGFFFFFCAARQEEWCSVSVWRGGFERGRAEVCEVEKGCVGRFG